MTVGDVVLAGLLSSVALSARAEADDRVATMRATCEPVMTVIDTQCEAQNYYACPDGGRFSETFSTDGSVSVEINDAEMNPVYLENLTTGEGVRQILETAQPFSFSDLLRTGQSRGAVTAEIVMATPFPRPAALTVAASLTGEQRVLDGVTFLVGRAEVGIGMGLGGMMGVSEGPILVDPERRLLIIESATMTFNGASVPVGADVASIILPGEAGFQPDRASDACDGLLSLAPPTSEPPNG